MSAKGAYLGSKYKIGVTEAGDAGLDLSWEERLNEVDGAILISKSINPVSRDAVLRHKDKVIVHATITGYGCTELEPNVVPFRDAFAQVTRLLEAGFPRERVVIRVDPIIPTEKGIETAKEVISWGGALGFYRYRVSLIDMYPHVRSRFKAHGLPLPYGEGFSPSKEQREAVDEMLNECLGLWEGGPEKLFWPTAPEFPRGHEMRIESCAEPGLSATIQTGCVSAYDLALLGLDTTDADSAGRQRRNCLCYSGKVELLRHRHPCQHNCLYCYWKMVGEGK